MRIIKSETELNYNDLPILAKEKYLKIKSNNYGWIVNDKFILPFFIDRRLIFSRMVFTYGLIPRVKNFGITDEKEFLDNMVDYVKKNKICDFIYKAQSNVIFNICPKNSDCVEWGTYIVDLSKSEEELLKSFHGKHRNVIRKAEKEGVFIQITNNVEEIYTIVADTMKRQKVIHYPSFEYLKVLCNNLKENILCFKAVKDGNIQGVALFLYDNKVAYYMYGGSISRPFPGSINLLHYKAMCWFKKKNIKKYDFVGVRINFKKGSKYEGLNRFKSRFGSELIKGYSFRTIINPLKFKLFNITAKTYLKLKGFDYIDPIDSIKDFN